MSGTHRLPKNLYCYSPLIISGIALSALLINYFRKQKITRYDVDKRFTNALTYNDLVFMSGQVGNGSNIEEQTKSALEEIDSALLKAGSDKSKILELTIWLSDMAYYDAMNKVYDKWIVPSSPPPRACVQAKLAKPEYLIEIRVIAKV